MPVEKKYARDLIMHTIRGPAVQQVYSTYSAQPPVTQNVTYLPAARNVNAWTAARMEVYLKQIQSQGFIIGAKVRTRYGREGIIRGFIDTDVQTGFESKDVPNCIYITFDNEPAVCSNPYLVFNINELTLKENNNEC